jgi:hypothetical protein
MRSFFRVTLLTALIAVATTIAATTELIEPSEIAPGTSGLCVTELDGGELVEIPLTVIGTIGPGSAEGEIILVRLHGERWEKTGIIAGMSGSPVYIDGRLLGALAFGWQFSKEPIGGVTPFSRMLNLAETTPTTPATPASAASRPELIELIDALQRGDLGELVVDWLLPERGDGMQGLPLAMSISGMGMPSGGWLAESWRRLGWHQAMPAAGSDPEIEKELRPGAMVATVLIEGDISFASGGTVTEVRGDQVWAFGHPHLSLGSAVMPMAHAKVITVLPSQVNSFKFFSVGKTIGTFETDRKHGIWGRLGGTARMVPVTVSANEQSYSYRCLDNPVLMPFLASYLTDSSRTARGKNFGPMTARLHAEIEYSGLQPVVLQETFTGPDAGPRAASLVGSLVAFLGLSDFESPPLDAVRIRIDSSEQLEGVEIVDAVPQRTVVRPGMVIPVRLRLRPHRGPVQNHTIEIQAPAGLTAGRVDLIVAAGPSWNQYDLRMRPSRPASFTDDLDYVRRLRPSTRIIMALERLEAGVVLDGGYTSAPPSVVRSLRSGLGSNLKVTAYQVVGMTEQEMPFQVLGAFRIPLEVRLDGKEIKRTTEDS